jgi:hypothetical protein
MVGFSILIKDNLVLKKKDHFYKFVKTVFFDFLFKPRIVQQDFIFHLLNIKLSVLCG